MFSVADIIVAESSSADHPPMGLIDQLPNDGLESHHADANDRLHADDGTHTASDEQAITVLLVDDHPALREGLRQTLDAVPGIHVVGAAASAHEAIALVRLHQPDVLVLDMRLPDEDGLFVLRQVHADARATQVLVFTAHIDDAHVAAALHAGAAGYLNKDVATSQLVASIKAVASGRRVFSSEIASRVRQREGLLVNPRASHLTPREREILALLAEGLRYRAIAGRLSVTEATIKFHVLNLYQKLQSSSRVEALNRARQWGLLS
jgi:DNA-binding NarL/FixJ family response regulator